MLVKCVFVKVKVKVVVLMCIIVFKVVVVLLGWMFFSNYVYVLFCLLVDFIMLLCDVVVWVGVIECVVLCIVVELEEVGVL